MRGASRTGGFLGDSGSNGNDGSNGSNGVRVARAVMGIVGGVSYKLVLVGVSGISFFREAICSSFSLSCFS